MTDNWLYSSGSCFARNSVEKNSQNVTHVLYFPAKTFHLAHARLSEHRSSRTSSGDSPAAIYAMDNGSVLGGLCFLHLLVCC